jgi:hypothetical protein
MPGAAPRSDTARILEEMGLVRFVDAPRHRMTLTFDEGRAGQRADLEPELPLVLRW